MDGRWGALQYDGAGIRSNGLNMEEGVHGEWIEGTLGNPYLYGPCKATQNQVLLAKIAFHFSLPSHLVPLERNEGGIVTPVKLWKNHCSYGIRSSFCDRLVHSVYVVTYKHVFEGANEVGFHRKNSTGCVNVLPSLTFGAQRQIHCRF